MKIDIPIIINIITSADKSLNCRIFLNKVPIPKPRLTYSKMITEAHK